MLRLRLFYADHSARRQSVLDHAQSSGAGQSYQILMDAAEQTVHTQHGLEDLVALALVSNLR